MAVKGGWNEIAIGIGILVILIFAMTVPLRDCAPCWIYLHSHAAVSPSESGRVTHTCFQLIRCRLSRRTLIEQQMTESAR